MIIKAIIIATIMTSMIGFIHYALVHAETDDPRNSTPEDEEYRPRKRL